MSEIKQKTGNAEKNSVFLRKICDHRIIYLLIAVIGFAVSFRMFYPGWMSPDSCSQYRDALRGVYNSWHPVMMAWWWSVLNHVSSGPAVFLAQNLLFYWGGLYLITVTAHKRIGFWAVLCLAVGAFPSTLLIMGHIWKDAVFTSTMLLIIGIVFNSVESRKTGFLRLAVVVLLLAFAIGCKINGVFMALPLLLWWVWKDEKLSVKGKIAVFTASFALVILLPFVLNKVLPIEKKKSFQISQLHDLLGMSVREHRLLLPEYIVARTGITEENVAAYYTPDDNRRLFWGTPAGSLATTDKTELADLSEKWLNAILDRPEVYLRVRLSVFHSLMRFRPLYGASYDPICPMCVQNEWGFTYHMNCLTEKTIRLSERWCLFYPWPFMVVSFVITFFALFMKNDLKWFLLILGSNLILFVAPHFFVAPANQFRYLHFSYVCCLIQAAVIIGLIMNSLCGKGTHPAEPDDQPQKDGVK